MRVTIDRAGRLVVPKALRDELNLEAGTTLEIRVRDGRLELKPVVVADHQHHETGRPTSAGRAGRGA